MVNLEWNYLGPIPPIEIGAKIEAEKFRRELSEAFPAFVADFNYKFTAWQKKWFDPERPASSSALERCELPEYDPLLFLGPKTIPLVVFELSKPGNFIATTLYNHLETDNRAKVDPQDVLNYLTLNRHANLIVELNRERRERARAHIEAWKARRAQNLHLTTSAPSSPEESNSDTPLADPDTTCPEYDALVAMGSGIIAHVMLEYSRDRAGPWYKLMHQLVCETPAEDSGVSLLGGGGEYEYERWRDWFEHQEHHEACGGRTAAYLRNFGTWS
ncbi:hypothetical protein B0I37DRAFT_414233 [Chaetomium sp. MPI-CAGE-AT-0009]|nr:hypothetical protein B0I37DRAFT_414233 [Chaetomium sp. MPI-CAGE-AT-0009]